MLYLAIDLHRISTSYNLHLQVWLGRPVRAYEEVELLLKPVEACNKQRRFCFGFRKQGTTE